MEVNPVVLCVPKNYSIDGTKLEALGGYAGVFLVLLNTKVNM